jgi:hypothetical protein
LNRGSVAGVMATCSTFGSLRSLRAVAARSLVRCKAGSGSPPACDTSGRREQGYRRRPLDRAQSSTLSTMRMSRTTAVLPNPHDHVEIAITLMRAFGRLHLFDMGPENGVVRRQFADAGLPPGIVQIVRVSRHPSPPQQGQLVDKRSRAARGSPPLTRLVFFSVSILSDFVSP